VVEDRFLVIQFTAFISSLLNPELIHAWLRLLARIFTRPNYTASICAYGMFALCDEFIREYAGINLFSLADPKNCVPFHRCRVIS